MKRSLLLTLIGLLHFTAAAAQGSLEPCPLLLPNPYYDGVNRVIDKAVGRPSSLQLTTLPSFEAESGIRLVGAELYFVQFRSQFWSEAASYRRDGSYRMDFTKPKIITRVRHAPLSPSLMQRVRDVFSRAVSTAKTQNNMGLDGETFLISTQEGACARAWSPDARSANGRLIALMRRLEVPATLSSPPQLQRSERDIGRLLIVLERGYSGL